LLSLSVSKKGAEFVLSLSALVSLAGETPLTFAIGKQNVEMARYFLDQGADVNKVNDSGSPPLNLAVGEEGSIDLCAISIYCTYSSFPSVLFLHLY
jgi:hypothetical protein